jgi:hypothetical protein
VVLLKRAFTCLLVVAGFNVVADPVILLVDTFELLPFDLLFVVDRIERSWRDSVELTPAEFEANDLLVQ